MQSILATLYAEKAHRGLLKFSQKEYRRLAQLARRSTRARRVLPLAREVRP